MLVRAACGTIKQAGPHHSGTFSSTWAHIPGLIVVMPSNAADAKGLVKTALNTNNPVIFLEPKSLFSLKMQVPQSQYYLPLGKASLVRNGSHITIVASGLAVHRSLEAAKILAVNGTNAEIIDIRTIFPLDMDTIADSVARTGRLLVVDEDFAFCGISGEIIAGVIEQCASKLKSPPGRVTCEPVPSPFSPPLETAAMITTDKIVNGANAVLAGKPLVPTRICEKIDGNAGVQNLTCVTSAHAAQNCSNAENDGQITEIILPNQDLTVNEGTVTKWLKQVGSTVKQNEPVVEVETDKATMEIEAPAEGVLFKILVQEGTTIPFGTVIGHIRSAK
jgi:2-oxoisovalerate dehydrogenase E1 component